MFNMHYYYTVDIFKSFVGKKTYAKLETYTYTHLQIEKQSIVNCNSK